MIRRAILLLLALSLCGATAGAYDNDDFQYWNNESAAWKLNEDWVFTAEEEFRFGDDAHDFYYQHTDWGLKYSGLTEWLDVGINYRGVFEESKSDWTYENRPHLNLTVKMRSQGFTLSNRARMEFRIRQSAEDKPRYRHKATLTFPWRWTAWEIQPYLADEAFIDFEGTEFTRNRIYSGFSSRITKNLRCDIFYMLQHSKASANWNRSHVLGTALRVSF